MGCFENSNGGDVEESTSGLLSNSDILFPIGTEKEEEGFMNFLENTGEVLVVDKSRDCEGFDSAVLEQLPCFEAETPQLFNCNGDARDNLVLEKDSCPEVVCLMSNCNEDIEDPVGRFIPPLSQDNIGITTVGTGIDGEVPLVCIDGPDDGCLNSVPLVSEQTPNNEDGVDVLFYNETESSQLNHFSCSQSTEESSMEKTEFHCKYGTGQSKQDGDTSLGMSFSTASPPNYCPKWDEHAHNEIIIPTKETVEDHKGVVEELHNVRLLEEKNVSRVVDVLHGNPSTLLTHMPQSEENFCTIIEGSPKLDSEYANEGSASFQLSHVDISTSNCLGMPDHHESYDSAGARTCSLADSTMPEDKGRNDIVKPNIVTLSACSDVTHLVPRRSTRGSKLIQMTETKKTNRECRKPSNSMLLSGRSLEMSLTVARGKRSCSCKRARSSVWGTLENTIQVFKVNEVFLKHDSKSVQGSNRRRKGERVRSTLDSGSSRRSKGKHRPTTSRIRLKVKMGGERDPKNMNVVLPDVIDYTASAQTIISECALESNEQVRSETSKLFNDMEHKLGNSVDDTKQYPYPGRDLENSVTVFGASVPEFQHGDRDFESTLTQDISVGTISGDCPGFSSQSGTRVLGEAVDHQYLDPGTSPDSEVINIIQEAVVAEKIDEDLHDTVLSSPKLIGPIDSTSPNLNITSTSAGKKDDNSKGPYNLAGYFSVEENFLGSRNRNKPKKCVKTGVSVENDLNSSETVASTTRGNASTNFSHIERCPMESIPVPGLVELGAEAVIECCERSGEDIDVRPSELSTTEGVLATSKTGGPYLSKCSYSNVGLSKCRSRASDSKRRERGNARQRKSVSKSKVKAKDILVKVASKGENHSETDGDVNICSRAGNLSESEELAEISKINITGNDTLDDLGKTNTSNGVASADISESSLISNGSDNQILPPRNAWVCCDNCHKWRCISAALADSIEETKCQWICKDNVDNEFADCSVPQEKTNAEINAELELSEASCEEDACDTQSNPKGFESKHLPVSKPASWTLIKSNLFLHRKRKTQTIDEIMVCQCKPPQDGQLGCRDECLNRMLNLECGHGTCPCGNLCSNQRFQKRKYAKLKWFRSGKKGFGLQLLQNVSQGEFLIEYVGEVLNVLAYEARQKEYASRGQKHFYFMTLNGSEVIDACAKGNLGRFINHSCDPNCRTEKWIVNGEVCIGLFAVRDIKKGEEVTFDYNYERVDGAAAKRCVCGSSKCRGYIGADPLKTEAVVQGDSDEEYPEPVMVSEDGSYEDNMDILDPKINLNEGASVQHAESSLHVADAAQEIHSGVEQLSLEKKNSICRPSSSGQPSVLSVLTEDTISESQSAMQPLEISLETEGITYETSSAVQLLEMPKEKEDHIERTSSTIRPADLSVTTSIGSPLVKPSRTKSRPLVKPSRSSNSMKKGKSNQAQVLPNKPKKLLAFASSSRLNGVEEKLNELLDADGGISKRKDSGKGYLRLLLVTAASGDNVNGEAVQSTRDLSIILDALLKTKSKTVLVDIISKNGLQMLHNIMKQNRRNFNKTPIIRKLLKVLEYLALRQILTVEHINSGPPCAGVESFKESIIELAWHNDVQVHQIARKFRDKWIPRPHRRISCSNKDSSKMDIHSSRLLSASPSKQWQGQAVNSTETINGVANSGPSSDDFPVNGTRARKRKSRWDQPAEMSLDPRQPELMEDHKLESSSQQPEIKDVRDQVIKVSIDRNFCNSSDSNLSLQAEGTASVDTMQQIPEDVPPGFTSPFSSSPVPSSTPLESILHRESSDGEVINGCLQARYFSHLPVSYGIPLSFVEQLGTPQEGTVGNWTVAPSVPFHPFPPLPKFPRDKSNAPPPPSYGCGGVQREGNCSSTHQLDSSAPCTSRTRPPDIASGIGASDKRMRCSSSSLSRRYFKHQKVNNWKYGSASKKSGWGSWDNNSRSGEQNVGSRNTENEISGSSCPQGVNGRPEYRSSTVSQYPQHRYGH